MNRSINLRAPLSLVNSVVGKFVELKTGIASKAKNKATDVKEKVQDVHEKRSIIMEIISAPDDFDIHIHPNKDDDELVITFKKQES